MKLLMNCRLLALYPSQCLLLTGKQDNSGADKYGASTVDSRSIERL